MFTNRIHLRQETDEFLAEVLELPLEKQFSHFGVETKKELQRIHSKIEQRQRNPHFGQIKWHMIELESNKTIGSLGFHNWLKEHRRAEIGYFINVEYRGKGYMSEVLPKVISYGFNTMDLIRIEAFIAPDNQVSLHLIEKMKFKKEGLLRQHYIHEDVVYDSVVFGLLKGEE